MSSGSSTTLGPASRPTTADRPTGPGARRLRRREASVRRAIFRTKELQRFGSANGANSASAAEYNAHGPRRDKV